MYCRGVPDLTVLNRFSGMSERRGLPCRFNCEIEPGRPWAAIPKTSSDRKDLEAAIAERNAHELAVHGEVFFTPDLEFKVPFMPSIKKR